MTTPRDSLRPRAEASRGASFVSMRNAWQSRWRRTRRMRPLRAFFHFTDVGGSVLSAGMSYQALFAVFAALWVGFGLLNVWLRNRTELLKSLVEQIQLLAPGLIGENGLVSVSTLLNERTVDWTSIVAGAALLWVTISWFTGTRRSIRIIFGLDVREYRNAMLLKLRDFLLALIFFGALLASAVLTLFSSGLTAWLLDVSGADPNSWLLTGLGTAVRYAVIYAFDVVILLAIHVFLAEVRVKRWNLLSGCALGGGALLVLKILGTELLGGASNNPLLASFALLIGLLIWFNLICRTLLLTAAWIATGVDRNIGLLED